MFSLLKFFLKLRSKYIFSIRREAGKIRTLFNTKIEKSVISATIYIHTSVTSSLSLSSVIKSCWELLTSWRSSTCCSQTSNYTELSLIHIRKPRKKCNINILENILCLWILIQVPCALFFQPLPTKKENVRKVN